MTLRNKSAEYLYKGDPNSGYVIEYIDHNPPPKILSKKPKEDDNENKSKSEKARGHYKKKREYPDVFLEFQNEGIYIVEFYAPWCPHCQAYKPEYIKLAEEITKRTTVPVTFLAVSCTKYQYICDTYHVMGYPSVQGFPQDYLPTQDGIILNKGRAHPSATYISEQLGFQLSMGNFPGDSFEKKEVTFVTKEAEHDHYKKQKEQIQKSIQNKKTQYEETSVYDDIQDVYLDSYRSFAFAMRTSIYTSNHDSLPTERVEALYEFLNLLEWATPNDWIGLSLVRELKSNFDTIILGKADLLDLLDEYETQHGEDGLSMWGIQCNHGHEGYGYTCGLWTLFHMITIGAEKNLYDGLRLGKIISHQDISQTLFNYIKYFFGCDVCRDNFLKLYEECGYDQCGRFDRHIPAAADQSKELALWLWEVHNNVNVRLIGEYALREENRDVTEEEKAIAVWPTKDQCISCWKEKKNNGENYWNSDEVYEFLVQTYWSHDNRMMTHHSLDSSPRRTLSNHREGYLSGFGYISTFIICVFFFTFLYYSIGSKVIVRFMRTKRKKFGGTYKTK